MGLFSNTLEKSKFQWTLTENFSLLSILLSAAPQWRLGLPSNEVDNKRRGNSEWVDKGLRWGRKWLCNWVENGVVLWDRQSWRIRRVLGGVDVLSCFSCVWLCNPMDCSLPGSSNHEILQTRILEWFAMPSFRGFSHPTDGTSISYLLHWQVGSLSVGPRGKGKLEEVIFSREPVALRYQFYSNGAIW